MTYKITTPSLPPPFPKIETIIIIMIIITIMGERKRDRGRGG